jgi:glycosyltransferase involved in cell wall biosynthesis
LLSEGVPWQANLKAYYHLHKSLEYTFEHNFDIVHNHLSSSADMYIFPLSATLTKPHVTTLHGHFPFDKALDSWTGDADGYFMDWAQHVPLVASSESARMQVAYPTHFVGTVHNGIRMRDYTSTCTDIGNYFVWLGRFAPEKGAHIAIEAARKAQVPLILVGVRDQQDQDSMQYYRHMIEPYVDGKQIRYIGPISMSQKIDLLSHARALLNPVEWEEPFGMIQIEAMATGCPVIAFARGAATEIVTHGLTGFLAYNVQDVVHYISQIDEIDRNRVREYAIRHFSARTMAENYLRIYANVITAHALTDTVSARVNTAPLDDVKPENTRSMLSAQF